MTVVAPYPIRDTDTVLHELDKATENAHTNARELRRLTAELRQVVELEKGPPTDAA